MSDSYSPELVECQQVSNSNYKLPDPCLLFTPAMADDVSLLRQAIEDISACQGVELELRFDVMAVPRLLVRKI